METILKHTLALTDLIPQDLCHFLYPVAKKFLFDNITESKFLGLMNLNLLPKLISLKEDEKRRCYSFLKEVGNTIPNNKTANLWIIEVLNYLSLSNEDYKKQYFYVKKNGTNGRNREFRQELEQAFKNWEEEKEGVTKFRIYNELFDRIDYLKKFKDLLL